MENDRLGYEEMTDMFKKRDEELHEAQEEKEYKEIRRTSKRELANAYLESLSSSRPLETGIEPPMDRKPIPEIMNMAPSGEIITETRKERLLNSLKSDKYDYVVVEEQPKKSTHVEEKKGVSAKTKALAIITGITLIAGGIAYGNALHERDKNMMEGMTEYTEFLEETGQRPSEENYEYFIEHVHNEDVPQETSGGRTHG